MKQLPSRDMIAEKIYELPTEEFLKTSGVKYKKWKINITYSYGYLWVKLYYRQGWFFYREVSTYNFNSNIEALSAATETANRIYKKLLEEFSS